MQEVAQQRKEAEARWQELAGCQEAPLEEESLAKQLANIVSDIEEALNAAEWTSAERRQLLNQVVKRVTPQKDANGDWGAEVELQSPDSSATNSKFRQTVSMISTFALGTVTMRPSFNLASRTRTIVSDSTLVSSEGKPVTLPNIPK